MMNESSIIKIQKVYRGFRVRANRLPLIMYKLQKYLHDNQINLCDYNYDGRINSCTDETKIIQTLTEKFKDRIKVSTSRSWYDILIFDYMYGWLPVNIKTTTTITSDNIGNLATCVYSYTQEVLDFNKKYENGKTSKIILGCIKYKKYNKLIKKDYYFLVVNKKDTSDIIINSIKGLEILTSNINNLPFQVCWDKNRIFKYRNISYKIDMFIKCLKKPSASWIENFIKEVRLL